MLYTSLFTEWVTLRESFNILIIVLWTKTKVFGVACLSTSIPLPSLVVKAVVILAFSQFGRKPLPLYLRALHVLFLCLKCSPIAVFLHFSPLLVNAYKSQFTWHMSGAILANCWISSSPLLSVLLPSVYFFLVLFTVDLLVGQLQWD